MIKLSPLSKYYEKGDPIVFRDEMRDHRAGESYMTLTAQDQSDNYLGKIDYSIYENEIAIQMIKTADYARRKGVATALAKQLQQLYPQMEINWGSTTADGTKFLGTLPRTFTPNKRYLEIVKRLKHLNQKKAALDRLYNEWHELFDKDRARAEQLKPKLNSLNGMFQKVHDEIWELEQELIPMKQGEWKVNLQEDDDEPVDVDRLFWNDDYLEQIAEGFGYIADFSTVFWKQHYIPTLYHCTTPENFERIKVEGLKRMNDRRGATSNRHIGPAVFTTSEEDEVPFFSSYYGPIVIKINAKQMKADGFTPEVEREPDWARALMIAFVLHRLGDPDAEAARYVDSSDQNTEATVIIYSDIPVKYLSLV